MLGLGHINRAVPVTEAPFSARHKLKIGGDVSTASTRAAAKDERCSPVSLNLKATANEQNGQSKESMD